MKIGFKLSVNSIEDAREQIRNYKDHLKDKTDEFLERLSEVGIEVINANVAQATGADDKNVQIETEISRDGNKAVMTMTISGKDLLFIEYGAGIRFNNGNTHPWAHKHGYGIGTYPGQKHAFDPNGWYYRVPPGKGGKLHHSYGTEATMPVYKAHMEMIKQAEKIAKEVFNG